jgi:cyclophilin family peptidyl-prolyl cis-trans isomerase
MIAMIERRPLMSMLAAISAVLVLAAVGCSKPGSGSESATSDTSKTTAQSSKPAAALPPMKENAVYVKLTTTMGEIVIELDPEHAPISTENFLAYVDAGDYDGTIFHRVIDGFMVQGGGFDPDMTQRSTREMIKNEWQNGLTNAKYTIAMARLGNQPDSASSQFFINVGNNTFLDEPRDGAGYAVFGKVFAGEDVVDAIALVDTTMKGGHGDVPAEPVIVTKAERIEE